MIGHKIFIFVFLMNLLTYANSVGNDPTTVYIGVEVIDIRNIKVEDQSFDCEFYLNLSWNGKRSAKNFEFINANEFNKSHFEETIDSSGYHEIFCTVKGNFRSKMDVFNYPFDKHNLEIKIGDYNFKRDKLVYSKNDSTTDLDEFVDLLDWKIEPGGVDFKDSTYEYADGSYSIAEFSIIVKRKPLSFVIKILLPAVIIMSIAFLVLFIKRRELGPRTALAVTALLSLIALYLTISSSLPEVSYMSKVDMLFSLSYLLIFVIIVFSVAGFNTGKDSKEEYSPDKFLKWILPTVYFLSLVILFIL